MLKSKAVTVNNRMTDINRLDNWLMAVSTLVQTADQGQRLFTFMQHLSDHI